MTAAFTIAPARSTVELDEVRSLFRDYALTPDVGVCVQGFDEEIAALPGMYAEPRGTILLARVGPDAAGCGALKPIDGDVAELKRLFVRGAFRGRKIGEALAMAVIEAARSRGFGRLRLDTLPQMKEARVLYSRLGFAEVPPFNALPIAGAAYMELLL